MYRCKNFLAMKVLGSGGRNLGAIADIIPNFREGIIEGFSINGSALFNRKRKVVHTKDIIYYGDNMIVSSLVEEKGLTFDNIKDMEVVDICGNIIGIVEDIVFDNKFSIKGIIICPGVVKKLYEGKRILLIDEVIFGEDNVLFHGKTKFNFISLRHSINGVECNE
ncbi:MAG: hypothetical protein Q8930_13840 [Bacillota bacterium]|nr:hypothetical protein [Bacillota bacterium]